MIYHYTNRIAAHSIFVRRIIYAHPFTLMKEFLRAGPTRQVSKAAWFTEDDMFEGTVCAKMVIDGYATFDGNLFRFGIPDDHALSLDVIEFSAKHDIDPDWWGMSIMTAAQVGSDWRQWRLFEEDVRLPADATVEVWRGETWASFARASLAMA